MSNQHWPLVSLSDVVSPVQRPITVTPGQSYRTLGVKLWGEGAYERQTIHGGQTVASTLNEVHKDDLIINKIWVRHGSVAVVNAEVAGCCGSNEFPTFEFRRNLIHPRWMHWYSKSRDLWKKCDLLSQGTSGKNRIRPEKFMTIVVPLPPLKKQQRIVGRIDKLFDRVQEAITLRKLCIRESDLLVPSYCNELFLSRLKGKSDTVSLGEISEICSGVTLGRVITGSTIDLPYLRVANVQDGYLDLSCVKQVSVRADEHKKWQLASDDLLLTEGGDWDKLGRGTIWKNEIPNCIHQNHIFRVRITNPNFDPEYVQALTSSPYGKLYFQSASKKTTNLASINQRQLKAFPVFNISLIEQRRIVSKLHDLREKTRRLSGFSNQATNELNALLPSILDSAFKGAL